MLTIHKKVLFDEKKKPCAVQIPIEEFECIEDIIENYGLAKLIDEAQEEKNLPRKEAKKYYESLKKNMES